MFEEFTKERKLTEPLFLTVFWNRLERIAAYNIIKDACKKAGLDEKVGTHTLRKTFGFYTHFFSNKFLGIFFRFPNLFYF